MKYLLDSNICIYCINRKHPEVIKQVLRRQATDIAISAISKAEMYAGSYRRGSPKRYRDEQDRFFERFRSLPFDDPAADCYGRIHADLEVKGQLMGVADMQIAAIAMANNLTIVTHDRRGFSRLTDMSIEDWTQPQF